MFKEEIRGEEYHCLTDKEMQDIIRMKKLCESIIGDSK